MEKSVSSSLRTVPPLVLPSVDVYPYSHKDGAFSALGDPGSVVGDATGGTDHTDSADVAYVSEYYFLDDPILPNSHLYLILGQILA